MKDGRVRDILIDHLNKDRDWLKYWVDVKLDRLVDTEFYEKLRDAWKGGYDQGKEILNANEQD